MQPKGFSRRNFLKFSAATMGVAALATCAPAATPAGGGESAETGAQSADVIEISWYEWGDILDKQIADNTIASFEEAYPEIKVRLEQAPSNYYDKLQTALAAGTAADVLNTQTWLFQSYAAKGAMAPLDEYRSRDDYNTPYPEVWMSAYEPQTYFRGQLFGVPWNMNSMIMFYAKEPFDKAGLDYPTDDWTLDDFREMIQALTMEVDGVQYYGYQTNTSYERLACWMRGNGDKEWDREIEPITAMWDQEYIMDMINLQLYEVLNDFKVSPTPAMMQGGTNQLQSGNVAMKMEGPWFLPQMAGDIAKTEGGVAFDVVQLPRHPNGSRAHMLFGHVLTMNAKTEFPEETWSFLKWAGDEGGQQNVALAGRQPVTPEFNEKYFLPNTRETYGVENAQAFVDAFETGILHLAGEVDDRYITQEVFGPARDKMVAGEATAYELVPQMNTDIQAILDEYWAEQG